MPKKKEELGVTAAAEATESGAEVANLEDQAPEASTEISETANEDAVKPKRTRKKKTDSVDEKTLSEAGPSSAETDSSEEKTETAANRKNKPKADPILTLEVDGSVTTEANELDAVWHEIQTSYKTRRILTGMLGGIEKTENGSLIAVVYYKDFRTVIPVTEMMIHLMQDEAHDYGELALRQNKILNNMLGCEIDFLIKGLDPKTRSIVASRKEAMLKKRQIFYLDKDASGMPKVYEDRIVQARVIAVAEKVVRAEIFGVETSILARDLSFDWMGDARERFQVGDHILVRILDVRADSPEQVIVHADVKSVEGNTSKENMKKCKIQGKYAGTVEDIHKGTVFVRLSIGVNAIAHSCYDSRTVGKKDQVSFVVTHIDEERNVALGIITRIIKQTI